MSSPSSASPNTPNYDDLPEQLSRLLSGTGVSPDDTGGTITFLGRDPIFPSAIRLGSVFALSAMAAAVGAAVIWRMRAGQGQDLLIDLRKASHGIDPELAFGPTINGWPYPNPIGNKHPFTIFPFQTKDGRWVYPSAVYPAQQFAYTNFFDCGANFRSVADVLTAARDANTAGNGIGITALTRRGNLPYSRMTKLVTDLLGTGLLIETTQGDEEAKTRYRISEKGIEFLHTYAQFDEFAQTFGLRL